MTGSWFATDDDGEIDEAQQAVLDVLRAGANSGHWPAIDPAEISVALPGYVSHGCPHSRGK